MAYARRASKQSPAKSQQQTSPATPSAAPQTRRGPVAGQTRAEVPSPGESILAGLGDDPLFAVAGPRPAKMLDPDNPFLDPPPDPEGGFSMELPELEGSSMGVDLVPGVPEKTSASLGKDGLQLAYERPGAPRMFGGFDGQLHAGLGDDDANIRATLDPMSQSAGFALDYGDLSLSASGGADGFSANLAYGAPLMPTPAALMGAGGVQDRMNSGDYTGLAGQLAPLAGDGVDLGLGASLTADEDGIAGTVGVQGSF